MTRELTCDEAQALYFDRTSEVELDAATDQALDRHLASCAACQLFVKEVATLDEQLASVVRDSPDLNDPEETEADVARVLAAIKDYEAGRDDAAPASKPPTRRRSLPWGAALAAAVALFAAGIGLGRGSAPNSGLGTASMGHDLGLKELRQELTTAEAELDEARALRKQDARVFQARIEELEQELKAAKDE